MKKKLSVMLPIKKQFPEMGKERKNKMEKLRELKERVENIEITYDYEETYCNLKNAVIDYMNDTKDWDFDTIGEDIIDYELAEEQAKHELEQGGLIRLYYFLGDANLNNNLFKVDGYGNLEDIDISDLEYMKEEILDLINDKLSESEAK